MVRTVTPPVKSPLATVPATDPYTPLDFMARAMRAQIRRLESGEPCWQVPALKRRYQLEPDMHYHFSPELFLIVGGECEFQCPGRAFTVKADELCVLPGGIAHRERARRTNTEYRSIIVNFYNKTVYVHGAHDDGQGRPAADNMYFFTTPLYHDLITVLERVCALADDQAVDNRVAIRALLVATLALVAQLVESPQSQPSPVRDIVTRCQWLVKRHASHETLSIGWLAKELELSPNHLSRVFSEKTGERLGEYIACVRIQNATDGLRSTQLSVKAIGAACGFRDTSYFCRVFRQTVGMTPQDFRAQYFRANLEVESRPKTVLSSGASFVGGGVYAPLALTELNVFDALRCTRLSLKSIAAGCGFEDEESFAKFFETATGRTPAQYRADSQAD